MRTKVYTDIKQSNYSYEYKRFKFYFSSMFYLAKFEKELYNYINIEGIKMNNKYRVMLDSDEYLSLSLYKNIEKRGFKVYYLVENEYKQLNKDQTFQISLSFLNFC